MPGSVVAIQGERGAFSEEAARKLLGPRARVLPCEDFATAFGRVTRGKARYALLPIENTLAGSIHEVYDLLLERRLHISSEVKLPIIHHLIAFGETTQRNVREVYSHPVALAQCSKFFAAHPRIKKIPFYDTAGSVKMLGERRTPGAAAIASRVAARVYRARILRSHLEDHKENYTRFVLLSKNPKPSPKADKVSIVFSTPNTPGALFRCVSAFALRDINLAKLESRPWRGRPWEYLFYLDFDGHVKEDKVRRALAHLGEMTDFLRVLGCYTSA
jgi:prephenate dehydratase